MKKVRGREKSSPVREMPPGGVRRCWNHHCPHVQGHDSSHDGTGHHQIRTNNDTDKDVLIRILLLRLVPSVLHTFCELRSKSRTLGITFHFFSISAATTEITNVIMKRRGYTTTAWEGYQKTYFGTLERLKRSLCVFGTGEGDTRGKQVRNLVFFSENLGGH